MTGTKEGQVQGARQAEWLKPRSRRHLQQARVHTDVRFRGSNMFHIQAVTFRPQAPQKTICFAKNRIAPTGLS